MSRLPVLNTKGKRGVDLNFYYSKMLKEFINCGVKGDGKLNAYNRDAIGNINEYLMRSKEIIYRLCVAEKLLGDSDEKVNIIKTRISLGKQRKLIKAAKDILKKQGINKEWNDLFIYELKGLNKRLDWIENVVIKLNTETTVLDIYMRELEIQGITFLEDMEKHLTMEEPDEFGCVLNRNGDLMDAYITHVEDTINRSVLSEEEKQEYLAKKEIQLKAKAERAEKVKVAIQAEEKKWYEDTCNELMANAYLAEKHLINTYKNQKQVPKLVRLSQKLSETGEEYYTVFLCKKRKGRGSAKYLSKYEDGIGTASDIRQCCFVPASEMEKVEKMLRENDIAYGCYHIDGDRLQTIFFAIGYEAKVIYSRTGLFFDRSKDGTYREDASEYIEKAYLMIKEEYGMFTIYLQKSGEEKLVGLSESLTGAKTKARNYAIDYRCKKNLDISEEEILKELDKRVTKSPLYKNYTEALGI